MSDTERLRSYEPRYRSIYSRGRENAPAGGLHVQQIVDVSLERPAPTRGEGRPRTGGRMCEEQRQRRLEIWAEFIETELQARNMRPAQLALYANVNASTVSVWRHRESLPDREAV